MPLLHFFLQMKECILLCEYIMRNEKLRLVNLLNSTKPLATWQSFATHKLAKSGDHGTPVSHFWVFLSLQRQSSVFSESSVFVVKMH